MLQPHRFIPRQPKRVLTPEELFSVLKISDSKFAVVAEDIYDRKIEFIKAGNIYFTRRDELIGLLQATKKMGVCLEYYPIKERTYDGIFTVYIRRDSKERLG